MSKNTNTPLLDRVKYPKDMRDFSLDELKQLADEVRQDMIASVSQTGGHLGSGLGVVELTVALHYLFDTPHDRLIWDVGHQCYPHKILTGRRDQMHTLRQGDGLSGFTKSSESEYDPFGAAHSSTSISAGLGMARAAVLDGVNRHVVCVIGDGAMSAGMAFEAMNNAGNSDCRLIVILNDNDMSIAPPVGALSAYLSRLLSSKTILKFRKGALSLAGKMPRFINYTATRADEYMRGFMTGGTLFEELGFYYVGPIDGHNLDHILPVLNNVRDASVQGPILVHMVTQKGKGYKPAEQANDKYHGVSKFDLNTGHQQKSKSNTPSYTKIFSDYLIKFASSDDKIIAITAAMPSGTGIDKFADKFPTRCFDVGIAEQHAVTFAAGMAKEGYKPFVAIYSTFLQRAYDQIVHDVAIQKLPVRFAIDRAGLVGADGATHAGAFDITYLTCLPDFVVMVPSDEYELACMIKTAQNINDRPCAFRYPRGEATGVAISDNDIKPLEIGVGRVLQQGKEVAIISLGTRLEEVKKASAILQQQYNITPTIADARFAKPLDKNMLEDIAKNHKLILTIEEGAIGGFAAHVNEFYNELNYGNIVTNMHLPDIFIDHDDVHQQYQQAGLNSEDIVENIVKYHNNL